MERDGRVSAGTSGQAIAGSVTVSHEAAWTRCPAVGLGCVPVSYPQRAAEVARDGGRPQRHRFRYEPLAVSLKCEPELAEALRVTHAAVLPGHHLNTETLRPNGNVSSDPAKERQRSRSSTGFIT